MGQPNFEAIGQFAAPKHQLPFRDGGYYGNIRCCKSNEQVPSVSAISYTPGRLTHGCQRRCYGRVSIQAGERNTHAHCVNGSLFDNSTIPDPSKVEATTTIGGLLELVMQRDIEDAELCM